MTQSKWRQEGSQKTLYAHFLYIFLLLFIFAATTETVIKNEKEEKIKN